MYDNLSRVKDESTYLIDAMVSQRRDDGVPARVCWANSSTLQMEQRIGSAGHTLVIDASRSIAPAAGVITGTTAFYNAALYVGNGTGTDVLVATTGVGSAFVSVEADQYAATNYPNLIGRHLNDNGPYVNIDMETDVELAASEILVTLVESDLKVMAIYLADIVFTEPALPLEIKTITTEEYVDYESRELKNKFQKLVAKWQNEVMNTSSFTTMVTNNATYQEIIGIGPNAVPLILRQIESEGDDPDHWGWALNRITGEDPVPKSAAGDTVKIAAAWISWGRPGPSRHDQSQNGHPNGGISQACLVHCFCS